MISGLIKAVDDKLTASIFSIKERGYDGRQAMPELWFMECWHSAKVSDLKRVQVTGRSGLCYRHLQGTQFGAHVASLSLKSPLEGGEARGSSRIRRVLLSEALLAAGLEA